MKSELHRHFTVTKSAIGKTLEVEHLSELELLEHPLDPFIRNCIKNPQFDRLQISYFTEATTIQISD